MTAADRNIAISVLLFCAVVLVLEHTVTAWFWDCCTSEDALLEWWTAINYFIAAGVFVWAAVKLPWHWFWCLGYALMFLVVGGEEISWGQRVFGIATPENLKAVNVQEEFNLHNIEGIHTTVRLFGTLVVVAICFAAPILQRVAPPLRQLAAKLKLPIFPIAHIYIPLLAILFMSVTRFALGYINNSLDEVGEFLLSLGFLVFAWAIWRGRLLDTPTAIPTTQT